jgi:HAD superfamily hydrolase (TIGR01450 family)
MTTLPPETTLDELTDRYDALLIDAYGVLVHSDGAFPGAADFIDALRERQFPFWIVTNDASRLPETAADKYRRSGLDISADQVLTSGMLLEAYFEEHDLEQAPCLVLGTDDSKTYVERAGGRLVSVEEDFEVVVFGDDAGFPFRPTMDALITRLIQTFDAGRSLDLVLPNPDLIYQQGPDRFGVACGSHAGMIERVLAERFPVQTPSFDRLGKPHPPIYREATRRVGSDSIAMLGDQLATDIRGANAAGIDSVLVAGGVSNLEFSLEDSDVQPDYVMHSLVVD